MPAKLSYERHFTARRRERARQLADAFPSGVVLAVTLEHGKITATASASVGTRASLGIDHFDDSEFDLSVLAYNVKAEMLRVLAANLGIELTETPPDELPDGGFLVVEPEPAS